MSDTTHRSMPAQKAQIIERLQQDILRMQGVTPFLMQEDAVGLGAMEQSFPNSVFPRGCLHEFVSSGPEGAAAAGGFIGGLLSLMIKPDSIIVWISRARTLFPPGLTSFGINSDRIIFIDVSSPRDVLWAAEEALKCEGLAAVIAETRGLGLTEARRLQLAAETHRITCFIMQDNPKVTTPSVCAARWKISSVPSATQDNLPGVGDPRWHVELLKVRNGKVGKWQLEWSQGQFTAQPVTEITEDQDLQKRKVG